MITVRLGRRAARVLCLGAHSDDIEIGCGGTILTLIERSARLQSTGSSSAPIRQRRREARAQRARLPAAALARRRVDGEESFRDGFLPVHRRAGQGVLRRAQEQTSRRTWSSRISGMICHQDHRLVSRADLEHVPQSPHPGIRNSEVRRRPAVAEFLRSAVRIDLPPESAGVDALLRNAAEQAVVFGGFVPGTVAAARYRGRVSHALGRGVSLPEAVSRRREVRSSSVRRSVGQRTMFPGCHHV